jgi:hypothetical protein
MATLARCTAWLAAGEIRKQLRQLREAGVAPPPPPPRAVRVRRVAEVAEAPSWDSVRWNVSVVVASDNATAAVPFMAAYFAGLQARGWPGGAGLVSFEVVHFSDASLRGQDHAMADMFLLSRTHESVVLSRRSTFAAAGVALSPHGRGPAMLLTGRLVTPERCMRGLHSDPCDHGWFERLWAPCYSWTRAETPDQLNSWGCNHIMGGAGKFLWDYFVLEPPNKPPWGWRNPRQFSDGRTWEGP